MASTQVFFNCVGEHVKTTSFDTHCLNNVNKGITSYILNLKYNKYGMSFKCLKKETFKRVAKLLKNQAIRR